jgi:hypothetical protein
VGGGGWEAILPPASFESEADHPVGLCSLAGVAQVVGLQGGAKPACARAKFETTGKEIATYTRFTGITLFESEERGS